MVVEWLPECQEFRYERGDNNSWNQDFLAVVLSNCRVLAWQPEDFQVCDFARDDGWNGNHIDTPQSAEREMEWRSINI